MTLLKTIENCTAAGTVIAIGFAAVGHANMIEARDALAVPGKIYTAEIDGGQIKTGRRGSTTVNLNVSWIDAKGTKQSARQIDILSDLSNRIIKDKTLTADTIEIKVIEGERKPVIVEELPIRIKNGENVRNTFAIVGAAAAAIWFGLLFAGRGRREKAAGATANA